jgi:hypothetical protein
VPFFFVKFTGMNKYSKRFNIGFSLYQGIAGLIFTSMGIFGLLKWVFNVINQETEFSWGIFIGALSVCAFSATITFIIIRLGFEHLKK